MCESLSQSKIKKIDYSRVKISRKRINWIILFLFTYLQLTICHNSRNLRNMKCSNWFDTNCIRLMWKGDAMEDMSKSDAYEVSLVISSCGEEIDLFTNYTNDSNGTNIAVKSTTIISGPGCPEPSSPEDYNKNAITAVQSRWKYPEFQFIEWLTSLTESTFDESEELPEYYQLENTFILFLNGKSMHQNNIRKLDDILQSTIETGFGCVQRPAEKLSYYHNIDVLKDYSNTNANFGQYVDLLGLSSILDKELIPVCYGSSFAVLSKDLIRKSEALHSTAQAIVTDFEMHGQEEIVQYIELALASILSYQLPREKANKLIKYSTGINKETGSMGALRHDFRRSYMFKFFRGDTLVDIRRPQRKIRLTLVINHCNEDMSWMKEFLRSYKIRDVIIYSKCKSPINSYSPHAFTSETRQLPNYGRCDHSYAHWMANMKEEDASENHLVIFLKASRNSHYHSGMHYRSLQTMIRIGIENGFACGYQHDNAYFHNTPNMRKFALANYKRSIIKSSYDNMGQWLDAMNISLPSTTPVCYGGNFLAKASQILKKQISLELMEKSLMRADSIEEGHFAERSWAGLLSHPLDSNQTDVLQSIPTEISSDQEGYVGHLRLVGL